MSKKSGLPAPAGAMLNDNSGGPWGGRGGGGDGGSGGGPRNPWSQPPEGGKPRGPRPGATALDELLRRSRDRFGGGLPPGASGRPFLLYGIGAILLLWIVFTSMHRIAPQEVGVITRFGSYAGTLRPGIGFTFPAPIDNVEKLDVQGYRTVDIGSSSRESENLMLTGDQNLVDLAYSVSWNINNPERFLFQLAKPEDTIRDVAESAMRAVIATVSLQDAIGSGRAGIEQQVAQRMQELLNDYGAGVQVQVVAIKQADPPGAVIEAFKEVSSAQQTAQTYLNEARAYAQQLSAKAQGEAGAFDRVYAEYRLAPEVTRRRMYYETMEDVLSRVDKTIIEAPGVTPYLPLPQVKRSTPAQPAEPAR